MKVLLINNDGGGFADYVELPHGTTVQELFERQMRHAKPENYLIRVNHQPAVRDQVLVEGTAYPSPPPKSRELQSRLPSPLVQISLLSPGAQYAQSALSLFSRLGTMPPILATAPGY